MIEEENCKAKRKIPSEVHYNGRKKKKKPTIFDQFYTDCIKQL
jgi:hypothetical protein